MTIGAMSRLLGLILIPVLCAASACGDDDDGPVEVDAASLDAATPDAAQPDAALPDGALPDAAPSPATCDVDIACPSPSGGRVSVCGRLIDMETGAPIAVADATGIACDAATPAGDGPCAIAIEFYDPLSLVANPTGTPPLELDALVVDDCGRYSAHNVTRPFNGFVAIVVRDANGGDGMFLPVAEARAVEMNESVRGASARAVRRSTVAGWTTSAGDPFDGETFADVGAVLAQFLSADGPAAGVSTTGSGAPVAAFYFDDTDASVLSSVGGGTSTGPNGAALMVDRPLVQHAGMGAEPDGCVWQSRLAAAVSGFVFYSPHLAVSEGTDEPCP